MTIPPPDTIDDLESLRAADRSRFANELRAWIEVEDGRITAFGHDGRGHIGTTRIGIGPLQVAILAVAFPDMRPEPVASETAVRFVQTTVGRTGVAMPRPVKYSPYVQITIATSLDSRIQVRRGCAPPGAEAGNAGC